MRVTLHVPQSCMHSFLIQHRCPCCAPAQQPSKIIIASNKIPFCLMKCLKFRRDKLSYWMVDFSLATDLLKCCIPIEQISWATLEQWCQWFWVMGWLILSLGVLIRICGYNVNLLVHALTNIIVDMFYYRLKNMLWYHVHNLRLATMQWWLTMVDWT